MLLSVCKEEDTYNGSLMWSRGLQEVLTVNMSLSLSLCWKKGHEEASLAFQEWTASILSFLQSLKNLWPFLVLAVHVDGGNAREDLLSRDVVR